MKIEKQQWWTLMVVLPVAAGFAGGVWWPAHQQRQALEHRIARSEQALQAAAASRRHIRHWYAQIVSLRSRLGHFPQRLPEQTRLAEVLRGLSEALASSVEDQEVTTGKVSSSGGLTRIPIKLRFRGSFPAVYGVIRELETSDGLLRMDSLELHRPQGKASDSMLRARMELSAFFAGGNGG